MSAQLNLRSLGRRVAAAIVRRLRHEMRRASYGWALSAMSEVRKRWVVFCHPHAHVEFGRDVYLGPGFSVSIPEGGSLIVGSGVQFRRNFRAEISDRGRVSIGDGSILTYGVVIQCTTSIDVGQRCIVAQGTLLVDGSHRFRDLDRPVLQQGYDFRPIRIGDDAAIMSNCTVLADVGRHAFVGANAVVANEVPPFTVAVGAPARSVEYFGPDADDRAD